MDTVNSRIRKIRIERGWTQDELCERSGTSNSYLRKIENGTCSPSVEKLEKIADAFDVSVIYLLNDRIEEMENRAEIEEERLREIFKDIPPAQLELVDGLITQASRLRVLLNDNWTDILENGEYERFCQSKNQKPFDRKRPIVENYDNRDRTYKDILNQLIDLLPKRENQVSSRERLLGK